MRGTYYTTLGSCTWIEYGAYVCMCVYVCVVSVVVCGCVWLCVVVFGCVCVSVCARG